MAMQRPHHPMERIGAVRNSTRHWLWPSAEVVRPADSAGGLAVFLRLLRLAAPFWRGIALATIAGFATVASSVGLMTTSAYIIAKAALRPSIAELQVAIVGVRFFGIARGLFRYLERNLSHDVNFRLLARLRVWFYRALEPLAPARLMQYRSGDLLSRIVADIETLEDLYVRVLAPPLVAVLVGGSMWFFMGTFAPALAIVLLVALALTGVVLPILARRMGRPVGQRRVRVRSELTAAMVDGIQGVADLLAFGYGSRHQERIKELGRQLAGLQQRMGWITGLQGALSGLLMNLATIAVLVVAIPGVRSAELDGIVLAVLVLAVISSFEAVLPLPAAFQHLDSSLTAGRRLFEIVDAEPAVRSGRGPVAVPDRDSGPSLRVQNLTFRYTQEQPLALAGLDFALAAGGRLAVVGPTGAGKSTLVNLLLRLWDYEQGRIEVDGREIRDYCEEELRSIIGVVSQHTHLFNATVRENLLMARPEAGEEDIMRAAEQARLHQFVLALPEGYDTWVGEQGLRLSAGERQRLAIARTIIKDAPILVLDEATANLDAVTEQEVMQELLALMHGRTTLIVTHRLVGLEAVDEILVLRAGRVAERGRHHELMQLRGLYCQMWELQSQALS